MGILKKKYHDKLDDDAREYINHAVEGAERMQALINGLLAYSRVGTRGGDLKPMSMQTAFDVAINNLQVAIGESKAVITHDELPDITADAAQMTQLLQNLIANAIKFCGKDLPEIHLMARHEDQHGVFGVRDNGIGIETQYFERIFMIFQRLHTRNQYPGTGIGLALCKKIVERHAGRIWIESEPGCGSTFYFTIPDKGDNQ
jgi:light-regulated signal transduction histidine kinase (bacteriophytochrome)